MTVNEYIVLKYIAKRNRVRKSDLLSVFKNASPTIEILKDRKWIFEDIDKSKEFFVYDMPYTYSLTPLGLSELNKFQAELIKLIAKCLIASIPVVLKVLNLIG